MSDPRPRGPRPRLPATLRARISALAALALLGVLSGAGAGLVLAQRAALVDAIDENLELQADTVLTRLARDGAVRDEDLPSDDVVVEVLAPDGSLVARSRGAGGALPGVAAGTEAEATTVRLPDGEPGRLVSRTAAAGTVVVAGSLDDVEDSTAALTGALLVTVPLAGVLLAGVVWWAVGRALRPVEDIRARVDAVTAAHLDRRVPEPAAPREIARLAHTMNAMLARLHRAAEEQRRFVADASHELRSPLARMRAELEVDAAHPASADPAATAASVLAETVELQRLVDDLLLLAAGDAAAGPPPDDPVDLDDVVQRVVAAQRDLRVVARELPPVQVLGNRTQLERLVTNLLDNAVRHARARIDVTLAATAAEAVLVVSDDGAGIAPQDAERSFERFTRLDEARSGPVGGAGLGLAIARDIAERHGGSIALGPAAAAGGATFVVRLPLAPVPGGVV